MLLAEVVATSAHIATTAKRSAKIKALAEVVSRADVAEVGPIVAFLTGQPRQGKVGIGWAVLSSVDVSAASTPSLTVGDLDRAVTELQALTGPGSVDRRSAAVGRLFARATVDEASFIRRLLGGELRHGALEGVLTDAVARAAGVPGDLLRRALMLDGSLPRVARIALEHHEAGLAAVRLTVLRPVQPMLASTAATVATAIAECGMSSVEWKLDGARIQAHRRGSVVRLFTRNLNDVTARLPTVVEIVRSLRADAIVLDGEVLSVDDDAHPDLFQDTISRFSRHDGDGEDLSVWFFDCLHVDGRDLLEDPLLERQGALTKVAEPWRIPSIVTDDPDEAASFLERALEAGHEGVMVKTASSTYESGRRGKAWRKVKPVHTLDLVVLGAEWGHGRRRGWLSNLHLGARDPAGGYVMVGKTFKGLTDELLRWQTDQLLSLEVARRGIAVEVRPALVVEVALDGVQASVRYPGGIALRFARVRRYRADKTPEEADGIETLRALLAKDRDDRRER